MTNDAWKMMPLSSANLSELVRMTKDYFAELNVDPEFHGLDEDLTAPLKAYQTPRGGFWLIKNGGEQAMGMAGVLPLAPRTCELRRLYVAPAGRGWRLGQKLLEQALQFARAAGYFEILATLRPDQTHARILFEDAGFKPCARYKPKQQAGIFLAYKLSSGI